VDHDGAAVAVAQVGEREAIGRHPHPRGAVALDEQRRQVAVVGAVRLAAGLEVTHGRLEGRALALADGVDVEAVEARLQAARGDQQVDWPAGGRGGHPDGADGLAAGVAERDGEGTQIIVALREGDDGQGAARGDGRGESGEQT
jgi:hypothetical protein